MTPNIAEKFIEKTSDLASKLIDLANDFRRLCVAEKDLAFRKAQWARAARGCFKDDRRFIAWCKSDLGIADAKAQDLCFMARAAGIVTDLRVWNQAGGMSQIRHVEGLDKREQVIVLEAARATGRSIRSIVKERHPERHPAEPSLSPTPAKKREMGDLEVLACFIAENESRLPKLPESVDVLVRMYAPRKARAHHVIEHECPLHAAATGECDCLPEDIYPGRAPIERGPVSAKPVHPKVLERMALLESAPEDLIAWAREAHKQMSGSQHAAVQKRLTSSPRKLGN